MTRDLSTHVVDVDIQSWMDNALDDTTWGHSHTIYDDGAVSIFIELTQINTQDNELIYEVTVDVNDYNYMGIVINNSDENNLTIKRDNYNLRVTYNGLIGKIKTGLEYAMLWGIHGSSITYKKLRENYMDRREMVRDEYAAAFSQLVNADDVDEDMYKHLRNTYITKRMSDNETLPEPHTEYARSTRDAIVNEYMARIEDTLKLKED